MNCTIRKIKPQEAQLLNNFVYEAIFRKEGEEPLPREIINKPELQNYVKDFNKPDDFCLVAEIQGKVVGAVWTRILDGEIKGYGHIDSETPEFAISVYKEYRGRGIGTALMKNMLQLLKEKKYNRASLAVQKENYAAKMYLDLGFEIVDELDEEYLMVYNFKKPE